MKDETQSLLPEGLEDFRNFLWLVWSFLGLPPPTPVQYDMALVLQHGPRRLLIEAFRGVGKSWITSAFVIWCLLKNPEERVMVVSASKDRADAFSTFTKRLINEMPELAVLKPRAGQRDSNVAFDVGPSRPAHAPSVKSVGITGNLTGSRATLIIPDDIENPKNSLTQTMRDRLGELVKEFDAVLNTGGRVVYLGTPQTEMSLYRHLPERGYQLVVWPARVPGPRQLKGYGHALGPIIQKMVDAGVPEGTPTDPDRFDDADLLDRGRSYGRSGFLLQFMLDTSLSDTERYPLKLRDLIVMSVDPRQGPDTVIWAGGPETLREDLPGVGLQGDAFHGPMQVDSVFRPFTGTVMAIDPSGRGKDETSYAVVRFLNGNLYLVAVGGFAGGYEDSTLQGLADAAKRYGVNHVRVESNFGDGMFLKLLEPYLTRTHPCATDEVRATTQKEARIIDTLEPVMNQHRLIVDEAVVRKDYELSQMGYEQQPYKTLFYQMTRLSAARGALRHDDKIDVVSMAVQYWVDVMDMDQKRVAARKQEGDLKRQLTGFLNHVGFQAKPTVRRQALPGRRKARTILKV